MEIKEYEILMWEAAKNRDKEAFLKRVESSAIMVCGGYQCSGAEYAEIVKDFDMESFEITNFEIVCQTKETCQVHYVIETKATKEENKDLEGVFHITTTWKKIKDEWKVVFNMDSRVAF